MADWYRFEVPAGSVLSVTFTVDSEAERTSAELYNPNEEIIWNAYDVMSGRSAGGQYVVSDQAAGTYYLRVADGVGQYAFGGSFSGQLGDTDYADWYRFDVEGGSILRLSGGPTEDAEHLNILLYNVNEEVI